MKKTNAKMEKLKRHSNKGITLIALVITIVQNFIACRCQEFDICIALNFKYILLIFLSLMSKYAMKSYIKS